MPDPHDEFVAKHTEVLALRKRAEDLRYQLQLVEGRLQSMERESAAMFHNLFWVARTRAAGQ